MSRAKEPGPVATGNQVGGYFRSSEPSSVPPAASTTAPIPLLAGLRSTGSYGVENLSDSAPQITQPSLGVRPNISNFDPGHKDSTRS
jgi:hypothetical protein